MHGGEFTGVDAAARLAAWGDRAGARRHGTGRGDRRAAGDRRGPARRAGQGVEEHGGQADRAGQRDGDGTK
mgnify:CR=1 FL=1